MAATTPKHDQTKTKNPSPTNQAGQRENPEESEREPARAGQLNSAMSYSARTAADIPPLVERLNDFTRDELRQIRILDTGSKLKQGSTYLDLRNPTSVPFTATADIVAQDINLYAAKSDTPYEFWNRLVELLGPARILEHAPKEAAENQPFTPERAAEESAVERVRREKIGGMRATDSKVDEASAESFPASDPPSWNTGRDRSHDNEKDK
jgi:hypothetical protein